MGIKLYWNKDKRKEAKMSKQKNEYNTTLLYPYASKHVNFLSVSFKRQKKQKCQNRKNECNPTLPYTYANTHINFLINFI